MNIYQAKYFEVSGPHVLAHCGKDERGSIDFILNDEAEVIIVDPRIVSIAKARGVESCEGQWGEIRHCLMNLPGDVAKTGFIVYVGREVWEPCDKEKGIERLVKYIKEKNHKRNRLAEGLRKRIDELEQRIAELERR